MPEQKGSGPDAGTGQSLQTRGEEHGFWLQRSLRTVIFFALALTTAGVWAFFQTPIAVFPETNFPRVVIGVDNGVMPVEQMNVTITRPIENAVSSVPGLSMIRSNTSRGSAEVDLFFGWSADMFRTLELVNAAIAQVQASLPSTAKITTNRLTFATFPILGYSLTSSTVPQTELWQLAYYTMKPALNRVPGVMTVTVQGGQVPEYQVVPNLAKLQAAGVTILDLVNAIQSSNIIDSPGLYQQDHQLVLALVGSQAHDVAGLRQLAVKTTASGAPVRIGDLAEVKPSVEPVYTVVTANERPAVLLNIARQPEGNTVSVADGVAQEMTLLEKKLPPGVTVAPFYDQSELVRESIRSVRDAILIGLTLACVILFLFLRDWRSSIIAGLVIPVTVAVAVLFLHAIGESFNLMTLGGLAAAIGLVIDDAIVVVENIVLHRDTGAGRVEAVRAAFREIAKPLIGSTITPVVVFLPLVAVPGVTGSFFRALAITMTVSLLTSLLLAMTWTPSLAILLLKPHVETVPRTDEAAARSPGSDAPLATADAVHAKPGSVLARMMRWHLNALNWAVRRPVWLGAVCLLLIAGTYFGYKSLGSDLLPYMDEGGFILDYVMPAGSSLESTNRVLQHATQILHDVPEVEYTSRRTGLQMGLAAVTEANTGDMTVRLRRNRSRGVDAVMADVRARVKAAEPELDIELTQILQDNINDLSNAPEPIQIKLYSDDDALLNEIAPRIATEIATVDGVVDVENGIDNTVSGPATNFAIDPQLAARLGFTPTELAEDATSILDGVTVPDPLITGGRPYTIRVRLGDETRQSLDTIRDTVFNSASGHTASLGSMADVTQLPPQQEYRTENLQRLAVVTADLEGTDLGTAVREVQAHVNAMHLPARLRVEYGGTYQEQQQSFHDLLRVLLMAMVLVFGVLLTEFRNLAGPAAILTSSVLSVAGVIAALLVTGTTFNVASFMGLIMVIGIVAKNGILLLDADERYRADGVNALDAMRLAAERRLRPIMMTALAAVMGMLPLALGLGSGSQMLQPLAIAVIGGLLISLLLSLVVTPVVYYFMTRRHAPVVIS